MKPRIRFWSGCWWCGFNGEQHGLGSTPLIAYFRWQWGGFAPAPNTRVVYVDRKAA